MNLLGCVYCAYRWIVDRFTKRLFWNLIWSQVELLEEYIAEQMLQKKFRSNVAPSLSSGPPLFYKAEYKGKISKTLLQALTFDWSVLRTSSLHHPTTFLKFFSGIPHLLTFGLVPGVCTWHLAARCQVPTPGTWHHTKSRQVGYP